VNEVTKAVIARYNAAELLTKRDQVSKAIGEQLTQRAKDFEILLDDVSITHLAFSKEYTAAVEAKQVGKLFGDIRCLVTCTTHAAQQEAERAKYVVEKAIQEKETIKIKADAEAQSAKLIGDVCTSAYACLSRSDCIFRRFEGTLGSLHCVVSKRQKTWPT
jgi:prohibitin 2